MSKEKRPDSDYDKESLDIGLDIEKEHAETIKELIEDVKNGKIKPFSYYFKNIAKDHIDEYKKYYNKKIGLPRMEEELKEKEVKKSEFDLQKAPKVFSHFEESSKSKENFVKDLNKNPQQKDEKATKTYPIKHGEKQYYHHVLEGTTPRSNKDATRVRHIISEHSDPKQKGVGAIEGEHYKSSQGPGHYQIHTSGIDKEHSGKGLGYKLYSSVINHHVNVKSDNELSQSSNKLYHKLSKDPKFEVELGKEAQHKPSHEGSPKEKEQMSEAEKQNHIVSVKGHRHSLVSARKGMKKSEDIDQFEMDQSEKETKPIKDIEDSHFIFSVENPVHPQHANLEASHEEVLSTLQDMGFEAKEINDDSLDDKGRPERSIMVLNPTIEQLRALHFLAQEAGQEMAIFVHPESKVLFHYHGDHAGKAIISDPMNKGEIANIARGAALGLAMLTASQYIDKQKASKNVIAPQQQERSAEAPKSSKSLKPKEIKENPSKIPTK